MTTKKKLCSIKGLSEAKVDKVKEAAMKLAGVILILYFFQCTISLHLNLSTMNELVCIFYQDSGFLTALEYADKRKQCFRISTGSQDFE